jgi:hypothetical protein
MLRRGAWVLHANAASPWTRALGRRFAAMACKNDRARRISTGAASDKGQKRTFLHRTCDVRFES